MKKLIILLIIALSFISCGTTYYVPSRTVHEPVYYNPSVVIYPSSHVSVYRPSYYYPRRPYRVVVPYRPRTSYRGYTNRGGRR